MKNYFVTTFFFLSLIFSVFSQSTKDAKPFTLNGEIIGKNSGKIVLRYWGETKFVSDTASILNGVFVFKGKIVEPTRAEIISKKEELNRTYIYLEPGIMTINLTAYKFGELKMTGSKTAQEQKQLMPQEENISRRRKVLNAEKQSIRDSINNTKDQAKLERLNKIFEEKVNQIVQLEDQQKIAEMNFILSHPKLYISLDLLETFDANEIISLDSLKSVYNKLDITIQDSRVGYRIKRDIIKKENGSIGANAPDFKAIDINKKKVKYSQFKGKNVVLLDFWASWCGPCRAAFPHLKNLYTKYHSKGFEIIAVSQDLTKNQWISAIKNDGIENWVHVPLAERYADGPEYFTKDDIYENYFVRAIPVQLLINKEGKIIGRWMGYSIEAENELDEKLAKLFKEN